MSTSVKHVPDGCQAVIPYLVVSDAAGLIEFIKQAFGAEEMMRMTNPDGSIGHTEMRVEGCVIMLSQAKDQWKPMPCMLYIYVRDVDAVFQRAVAAGASVVREPKDEFYGDRTAGVQDVCGNQWWLGTHKEDVSSDELQRRHAAALAAH
jgi:PhnB protein